MQAVKPIGNFPDPVRPDLGMVAPLAAKTHEELVGDLLRLSRQNASLRREVARLNVYRAMAYRDPLTGLWNRRYFEDRLHEELSRSRRAGPERRFSVMVVDVDDFKRVNDLHGHAAGDAVLKEVGEFLIAHLRNHDVACRTGGDEFAVLLPDLSAVDCSAMLDRLRAARLAANYEQGSPISLSLGTASWPEAGDSLDTILAQADRAMYAAKRRSKGRQRDRAAVQTVTAEVRQADSRGRARRVTARARSRASLA
jgi:diguanylate cyclase (GGDEF)-like protein